MQLKSIEFLYPTVRQFPFDAVCEHIVRELEKRNWQVQGIKVEFDEYGSGEQKFRLARSIKGRDFRLRFGRIQCTMPGGAWNDVAAVSEILIPKKEIHVYNDESGPTFYLYVGNKWKKDRKRFMNSSKVASKLNGEPRIYLQYHGECRCGSTRQSWGKDLSHTHPNSRSPLLVHNNDLGRDYDPKGNEPKAFKTVRVLDEFRQYLINNVLNYIKTRPIPNEKIDIFAPPPPTPFPQLAILGEIFTFADYSDAKRIGIGKVNKENIMPAERYAMTANGYRLMSLDTPNDGTVPEIAYEGFLWCGIAPTFIDAPIDSFKIPGSFSLGNGQFIIRVKLNRANSVYIADHAPYEKRREEIAKTIKDRDHYTNAEIADFKCARARTIIPISKYKGGYEQPIILINRELSFDEVEVVSGPHKHRFYR